MGILEDQARFLVAKYGTALGPTSISRSPTTVTPDIAGIMIVLGLLLLAAIIFVLVRENLRVQRVQDIERIRVRNFENSLDQAYG